ncbi:MAG: alpha/beta hydrolase, partial [Anaerolineae bacterium]|nr:alpha/beta hydrolase [Anaerolineae bacterium]
CYAVNITRLAAISHAIMPGMNSPSISSPAADLYYECSGHGADVLLLHGWASSGRMWTSLADAIGDVARCWSVDLPGFGRSSLPHHIRPDLNAHLAWIVAFCEQHQIQPKVVIGHSMGGLLALKLAHARPDLAQSLVLMCPVVTGRFGLSANDVFTSQFWMMISARTRKVWSISTSDRLAPVFSAPFYVDKALRPRYVHDFQATSWDAAVAALESIAQDTMRPHLAEITQPALVVVGTRDFTVPPAEGRLAAEAMPNARLVEFERAHHQPLDEEPDRFIALVREFIVTERDRTRVP